VIRIAVALGLILFASTPAVAQDWNCSDPDNLPQQGMNYCASMDFERADAVLNAALKSVYPKIKAREVDLDDQWRGFPDAVLDAQRAWIKFRDTHCAAEGFKYRGGSIEPLIYQSCRAKLTEKRTKQINSLLEE
jgi:uncharacterized protein YecT (DUF1311 family)